MDGCHGDGSGWWGWGSGQGEPGLDTHPATQSIARHHEALIRACGGIGAILAQQLAQSSAVQPGPEPPKTIKQRPWGKQKTSLQHHIGQLQA